MTVSCIVKRFCRAYKPKVLYPWLSRKMRYFTIETLVLAVSLPSVAVRVKVLLPAAVFFSVVFCRLIHWYCHMEQYTGLLNALTDYSGGGDDDLTAA